MAKPFPETDNIFRSGPLHAEHLTITLRGSDRYKYNTAISRILQVVEEVRLLTIWSKQAK